MKIANIIHDSELINHHTCEYINYCTEGDLVNFSLPTLYVGWKRVKDIFSNLDILNKTITPNLLYWEFSFDEHKSDSISGVNLFIINAPHFYFKPKYECINIDPVFFNHNMIVDVINSLPEKIEVTYNYKDEILYLLSDNKIFILNLSMYDYFNFECEKILEEVYSRTKTLHLDLDGETYQKYKKIFPNYIQLKRYMVHILK